MCTDHFEQTLKLAPPTISCLLRPERRGFIQVFTDCLSIHAHQTQISFSKSTFSIEYFSIGGGIAEHFLFLRTTAYFMHVKGTFFPEQSKNRLIFQLDVRWVAALLGTNANVLDIFLCIFAVSRVASIVYYVSAFLLSVWHPKQQYWMNKCLEAAGDGFCHFYFCTLLGIEWMICMEMASYVWSLKYFKRMQTKSTNYFVQLSECWSCRGGKCVAFKTQMSFSPTVFTKRLSNSFHMVCVSKLISRGQQCSTDS